MLRILRGMGPSTCSAFFAKEVDVILTDGQSIALMYGRLPGGGVVAVAGASLAVAMAGSGAAGFVRPGR